MITENKREPVMGLTFEKVWAMFQETDRQLKEISQEQKETDRQLKEISQEQKETAQQLKEISQEQKETAQQLKEISQQQKETDRQFKETDRQFKETAQQIKEISQQQKETDRQFKETAQQLKEISRQQKETDRQSKETERKISKLGSRLGDLVEHIVTPNLLKKFNEYNFNFGKIGTDILFEDSDGKAVAEVDAMLENGDTVMVVEVKTKLTTQDVREHTQRMEKLRKYADDRNDKRGLMGAVAGAIVPENVKQFALTSGFFVIEQSGDTVKIAVPPGFVPKKW